MSAYQGSRVLIKKRVSSRMRSSNREGAVADGNKQINLVKTRDFLDLVVNSKSNS